ncbi:hypothetical protein [Granulicella paludicola]|uniref:hypothetical protein n=1 Tax=Granulicella paludicola TaxID=474951 RepID=UPI0021E09C3A|nr:hypothetical protein [Granulicella paludicola]
MSSRLLKPMSLFLGVVMFLFGFLKFLSPFSGWFDIQIQQSHLPHAAILAGKLTEMLTGLLFLLPWFLKSLKKNRAQVILLACLILFTQMVVAIYVHLQPGVPASVLPLGIKPPIIPITVLVFGLFTASAAWKAEQTDSSAPIR